MIIGYNRHYHMRGQIAIYGDFVIFRYKFIFGYKIYQGSFFNNTKCLPVENDVISNFRMKFYIRYPIL